jgi:6-phosphogluconolactonase
MKVEILPSPAAVAEAAGRFFIAAATAAVAARGRFTVALSGGSTPEVLYRWLAAPERAAQVNWPRVEVFFGDERCVPPDDPASNYGTAREALLSRVPLPPGNVHRVLGELPPEEAASAYERELGGVFYGEQPRFDLILLGMGDDGHTASLFPGMSALQERGRWCVATAVPAYVKPSVPRVTLTFPALNAARNVAFLVTGQGKAARVAEALSQAGEGSLLPAAQVNPSSGALTWLLDEHAAAQLEG